MPRRRCTTINATGIVRRGYADSVIDTHCHLTFPDFADEKFPGGIPAVLREAADAGVDGCITISTTTRDCLRALEVARNHERVWCSSGVHPLYSGERPHDWDAIRRVAEDSKCVAFGELGLDNHYPEPSRDLQHAVLAEQLERIMRWREEGLSLPIILHCREAFDDLIPILKRTRLDPTRMVFHCFTGTPDDMRKVLDFGAWVSFTGVVTYRNAREVREAVRLAPPDRVMIETDAPFLSPEPRRGERPCRPWMCSLTARRLAELRGEAFEVFHERVNDNTRRFFGIRC
jgi:TatD DNase family protein